LREGRRGNDDDGDDRRAQLMSKVKWTRELLIIALSSR
jgi:hypothetical protein